LPAPGVFGEDPPTTLAIAHDLEVLRFTFEGRPVALAVEADADGAPIPALPD
jgi:hypothetical protein